MQTTKSINTTQDKARRKTGYIKISHFLHVYQKSLVTKYSYV